LPRASSSEVIGLLNYLNARAGREVVFHIAAELGCPLQKVFDAVKAAEMLGFVSTPGPMVFLASEGR
jgi:NitT/TauT family transport system ATP-binding protein